MPSGNSRMHSTSGNRDMPAPLVSVIINCLNGERYLQEALDSVVAQTLTDWEVVFWDNASDDRSTDIARAYGERVRCFRSPQTYSLGKARNLAVRQARGRYLAFLDCDDIWLPRKLEKQVPLFERNPRVALVFCDTIFFNSRGDLGSVYKKRKPPRGAVFRALLADYFLSMETVVVRTEALAGLGEGFDERFSMVEEKDLFLRLAHEHELDYVDEPLAKWRVHDKSWTQTHYELFSVENELLLRKLRERYDDFDRTYAGEVRAQERKIAWQRALAEWKGGRTARCREILGPYRAGDPKMTAAYLLSYLGARSFAPLMALYHRARRY